MRRSMDASASFSKAFTFGVVSSFLTAGLIRDRTKRYSPKRTHAVVNVRGVNPKNQTTIARVIAKHPHANAITREGSPKGPGARFSSCGRTDQRLRQPLS